MTSPGPASPTYIVHRDPVERRDANHIAQVDLSPFGLAGQFEQLWLHDLGDGTFALACIPFMAYGLALGDAVSLSPEGKLATVIRSRGHRVLRMLLAEDGDQDRLAQAIEEVKACVVVAGFLSESHGPRFIAVDIPPHADAQSVFDCMGRIVEQGRGHWEWADACAFAA